MPQDNSQLVGTIEGVNSFLGGINPVYGNIIAGMKNTEAQKRKEQLIGNYAQNAEARYNNLAKRDFLDSNVASSMITRIKERLQNANNMADKQAATTGATNEATLAAKTANQEQFNDVVSQIAGMGTAREDQLTGRHMNEEANILGLKTGIQNDKMQAAQTQAANANETMNSMLSGISTLAGVPGVSTAFSTPTGNQQVAQIQQVATPIDNSVMLGQTGPSLVAPTNNYGYVPYDIYNPLQYLKK